MAKIKRKYVDQLKEYQQKLKSVASSCEVDYDESFGDKQKRIKMLLSDYDKFSQYYFAKWCKGDCAPFHIKLPNDILHKKYYFGVKKWSRALAKTTHGAIISPIFLMLNNDLNFLLLASATSDSAIQILSNIQAQLEANPRLIHDFGEFKQFGDWELGNFKTKSGVLFKAIGRKQKPRGLLDDGNRPDLIICDDLDDDELVKNQKLVTDAAEWTFGALFGCSNPNRARFLMLGNQIAKYCILSIACSKPNSVVEQINLLDENGKPSWNYYSLEAALSVIDTVGYITAQREYFNNPIEEGTIYKEEYFQYKARRPFAEYDAIICYTDPSFKSGSKNDFKATILIGKYKHEYHILKAFVEQTTVYKMVDWHYEIMSFVNGEGNVNYYMEANFIQDILLDNFDDEAKKRKLAVPIRGDKRKKPDKYGRIEAMSPYFEKGYVYIGITQKDNPHIQRMIGQFTSFEKGSKAPDDAPDAVEGAIYLLNKATRGNELPTIINTKRTSKYRY